MELSSSDLLKKLPTYEDIVSLIDGISAQLLNKLLLEKDIRIKEAEIIKRVMTEERFFVNGKPPSVAFADTAYMYTGIDGELVPMRENLAVIISELEKNKARLDIYKESLNIWRTLSASERSVMS